MRDWCFVVSFVRNHQNPLCMMMKSCLFQLSLQKSQATYHALCQNHRRWCNLFLLIWFFSFFWFATYYTFAIDWHLLSLLCSFYHFYWELLLGFLNIWFKIFANNLSDGWYTFDMYSIWSADPLIYLSMAPKFQKSFNKYLFLLWVLIEILEAHINHLVILQCFL